jgi:hypothetical protein
VSSVAPSRPLLNIFSSKTPTLLAVDEHVVRGKIVEPRGCDEIQTFLARWLK